MRSVVLALAISALAASAAAAQGSCRVVDPAGSPQGTPIPVLEGPGSQRIIGHVPNGHVFHYAGVTDGPKPGNFVPAVPVHIGNVTIFGIIDPDYLRCPP
jgi:hypothetical protein